MARKFLNCSDVFFRQDFVSLKQLTRLVIDGCEVEDTLELGANLFIGNTDLKVRSSVSQFFYFESVKGSGNPVPFSLHPP